MAGNCAQGPRLGHLADVAAAPAWAHWPRRIGNPAQPHHIHRSPVMHTSAKLAILSALTALVAACGGGNDSPADAAAPAVTPPAAAAPTADAKGKFVDSAVEGLAYDCGGVKGVTNGDGEFDFVTGQSCTFKVGGITLGSALAKPMLTPVDLVPGAVDETNPAVNNMTRLLMSLDADNNPANGILVDDSVRTALASATLPALTDAGWAAAATTLVASAIPGRALASTAQANTHLGISLLGLFTGHYECQYTGASSGSVVVDIANGNIVGTGKPDGSTSTFDVDGSLESSGSANLSAGTTTTGATYVGTFLSSGSGSGSWTDTSAGKGSWTCTRK
jgi:hypothetical protein